MSTIEGTSTFEFPDSFEKQLEEIARLMIEKDLDKMEIPESGGMVLYREDSSSYLDRHPDHSPRPPFFYKGRTFIVCMGD